MSHFERVGRRTRLSLEAVGPDRLREAQVGALLALAAHDAASLFRPRDLRRGPPPARDPMDAVARCAGGPCRPSPSHAAAERREASAWQVRLHVSTNACA